MNFEQS